MIQETTIIAIAGISGTLIGSLLTACISAWSAQKTKHMELDSKIVMERVSRREALYCEFLSELHHIALQASSEKFSDAKPFSRASALASNIQLISVELGQLAYELVSCVMGLHTQGKNEAEVSFAELRNKFVQYCREDIDAIQKSLCTRQKS